MPSEFDPHRLIPGRDVDYKRRNPADVLHDELALVAPVIPVGSDPTATLIKELRDMLHILCLERDPTAGCHGLMEDASKWLREFKTGQRTRPVGSEAREIIERGTYGSPPDRACLPGSDEKWRGYQLGVEDAIHATEEWLGQGTGHERVISATDLQDKLDTAIAEARRLRTQRDRYRAALIHATFGHGFDRQAGPCRCVPCEVLRAVDEHTAKTPSGGER